MQVFLHERKTGPGSADGTGSRQNRQPAKPAAGETGRRDLLDGFHKMHDGLKGETVSEESQTRDRSGRHR